MSRLLLLLLLLPLAACSSAQRSLITNSQQTQQLLDRAKSDTAQIADAVTEMKGASSQIRENTTVVSSVLSTMEPSPEVEQLQTLTLSTLNELDVLDPAIDQVQWSASDVDSILLQANNLQMEIQKSATEVQDKEKDWMKALKLAAFILVPVAIGFILWYSGIGRLLRRFFFSLGSLFIPAAAKDSAKLDLEALEKPDVLPQAVAVRRASDPAYDAAFRKLKRSSPEKPVSTDMSSEGFEPLSGNPEEE